MMHEPLAHVRQAASGAWLEHGLLEHLEGVSLLAAESANRFGSADWGRIGGLWHDLGKYSADFQNYIRSASGYEREEAHVEGKATRVDHSTAGAIHAVQSFGFKGRILAYLIAGHHAGLPDWFPTEESGPLLERLKREHLLQAALENTPPNRIQTQSIPSSRPVGGQDGFALWVRMLFSCLVDADFLDTEAFMNPGQSSLRAGTAAVRTMLQQFDTYIGEKFGLVKTTVVNELRNSVRLQCIQKAALAPGIFSLSVPTGGGKTLASLAFALNHAVAHGKRRIIYAIPYTSIIEQRRTYFATSSRTMSLNITAILIRTRRRRRAASHPKTGMPRSLSQRTFSCSSPCSRRGPAAFENFITSSIASSFWMRLNCSNPLFCNRSSIALDF
jgi:CRISPR-associated endonuclease/helicase Cas3